VGIQAICGILDFSIIKKLTQFNSGKQHNYKNKINKLTLLYLIPMPPGA